MPPPRWVSSRAMPSATKQSFNHDGYTMANSVTKSAVTPARLDPPRAALRPAGCASRRRTRCRRRPNCGATPATHSARAWRHRAGCRHSASPGRSRCPVHGMRDARAETAQAPRLSHGRRQLAVAGRTGGPWSDSLHSAALEMAVLTSRMR
jgi:hypothetical protein